LGKGQSCHVASVLEEASGQNREEWGARSDQGFRKAPEGVRSGVSGRDSRFRYINGEELLQVSIQSRETRFLTRFCYEGEDYINVGNSLLVGK